MARLLCILVASVLVAGCYSMEYTGSFRRVQTVGGESVEVTKSERVAYRSFFSSRPDSLPLGQPRIER